MRITAQKLKNYGIPLHKLEIREVPGREVLESKKKSKQERVSWIQTQSQLLQCLRQQDFTRVQTLFTTFALLWSCPAAGAFGVPEASQPLGAGPEAPVGGVWSTALPHLHCTCPGTLQPYSFNYFEPAIISLVPPYFSSFSCREVISVQ